jgi:3-hydroxyisobutyrate dehydrogenase-like beta-hydroxyacid dehydrogenase
VTKSDWILSILPPSEAFNFAQKIVDTLASANITGSPQFAYADCNAVNPTTVKKIAKLFEDMAGCTKFIDAGIIGGPPKEGYDPTIYASASSENATLLEQFGSFSQYGLKIELLTGDGVGVGDASALKMSYSVCHFFHLKYLSMTTYLLRELPKALLDYFLQ